MCIGDKGKLTIPPEFGYGQRAMGSKIPAGSTLGMWRLEGTQLRGAQSLADITV